MRSFAVEAYQNEFLPVDGSEVNAVVTVTADMGEAGPDRAIKAFSVSPDGTTLAAAGFVFELAGQRVSHSVWIWDLAPRRLRHRTCSDCGSRRPCSGSARPTPSMPSSRSLPVARLMPTPA